jgi:alpha-ribazole phosphatase
MILHLIRHPKPVVEPGICYGRLDLAAENAGALSRISLAGSICQAVCRCGAARCGAVGKLAGVAASAIRLLDERLAGNGFWASGKVKHWDDIPRPRAGCLGGRRGGLCAAGRGIAAGPAAAGTRFRGRPWTVPEAVIVTHAGVIRVLCSRLLAGLAAGTLDFEPVLDYASCTRVDLAR